MKTLRSFARAAMPLLISAAAACSSASAPETEHGQAPLTSVTARSRELRFEGVVYVPADASDFAVLAQVRRQTQTAFGALRTAQIGVNSRELKEVDPASFKTKKVDLVSAGAPPRPMLEVRYTYVDKAVVPTSMATRSSIGLAVMGPDYSLQTDRILQECTDNDSEAREFQTAIWYVFNPSLRSCGDAITAEKQKISAARRALKATKSQVVAEDVNRLYLPITAKLAGDNTNDAQSFPEYDRLFSGGVSPGKLVVGVLNGLIDHGEGTKWDDSGNSEWMATLREVFTARPDFTLVKSDPEVDLSTFTLSSGKKVAGLSFDEFMKWKLDFESHAGLEDAEQTELETLVGNRLAGTWLTFEAHANVQMGTDASKDLTLQLLTFFGADHDGAPYKRGIKESDVFLYNGHSFIGFGPLDPKNFSKADFPASYQILFIDGCVSYNYYEKDYIPLKEGGTTNLDLITNGLEAPSGDSGNALGKFIALLWSGKQPSYRDLLTSASSTDSLRVVDGELDNAYSPGGKPIVLSE